MKTRIGILYDFVFNKIENKKLNYKIVSHSKKLNKYLTII